MRSLRHFLAISLAILGFIPFFVEAATTAPDLVSYQGRLYDSSGNLLGGTGTTYCFRFSIHTTASGGSQLWPAGAPTPDQLQVRYGVFNALVGTADSLAGYDFSANPTSYLQIQVAPFSGSCGAYETLTPRQQIVSAGQSKNADTVDGADVGTGANNILKLTAAGAISIAGNATIGGGALGLGTASSQTGSIAFSNSTNANTLTIQSGVTSASYSLTLPPAQGAANSVLTNDGSGILSWSTSGCPACVVNGSSISALTNTVQPTADVPALSLRQTTAVGPTTDIFSISDSPGTGLLLRVTSMQGIILSPAAGQAVATSLATGSSATFAATGAPSTDLLSVTNAGQLPTVDNIAGLAVSYTAANNANTHSGANISITPGTSTGTIHGVQVSATAASATGGLLNGIMLNGPGVAGLGTDTALKIGTGWDRGIQVDSGNIYLKSVTPGIAPGAAITGYSQLYAADRLGISMPHFQSGDASTEIIRPSARDTHLVTVPASSAGAMVSDGATHSTLGTAALINNQVVGIATRFTSSAGVRNIGYSTTNTFYYRGTAGVGSASGFSYKSRIYLDGVLTNYTSTTTGTRMFFGMMSGTLGNLNVDHPVLHRVGFSYQPNTDAANFYFASCDNTAGGCVASRQNTGMALAVDKVYELEMRCELGCTTVYWEIQNLTDNTRQTGSVNTTLPAAATSLRAVSGMYALSTTARSFGLKQASYETPY
jgi:hypothetical protein